MVTAGEGMGPDSLCSNASEFIIIWVELKNTLPEHQPTHSLSYMPAIFKYSASLNLKRALIAGHSWEVVMLFFFSSVINTIL